MQPGRCFITSQVHGLEHDMELDKEIVCLRCKGLSEEQIKEILVMFFTTDQTLEEAFQRWTGKAKPPDLS